MKTLAPLSLLLVLACGSESPAPTPPEEGLPVDTSLPQDHPPLAGDGPRVTGLRRLTVDELQATIPVVAGLDDVGAPITWTVTQNGKTVEALDDAAFGKLLGRPDYVAVTSEDGSPNTLYVKFVRDMARGVCDAIVKADLARSDTPTLWRYAPVTSVATDAEIGENLAYLILRWLGERVAPGEPLLEGYREVYTTSMLAAGAAQTEGWRGVCIALFEDPAFHLH